MINQINKRILELQTELSEVRLDINVIKRANPETFENEADYKLLKIDEKRIHLVIETNKEIRDRIIESL